MMFGKDRECDGCRMRDETISDLREQLREAHKSLLSVTDKVAFRMRYPEPKPVRQNKPPEPPEERPTGLYNPPQTQAEIEKEFEAEADFQLARLAAGN